MRASFPTPLKLRRRHRLLAMLGTCVVMLGLQLGSAAAQTRSLRAVHYDGVVIHVPSGWPVFDLSPTSRTCVRFNRHALYLGRPGQSEACPVHSAGRTEAILVEPTGSSGTGAGLYGPDVTIHRRGRVTITATWRNDPNLIRRALDLRTLSGSRAPVQTDLRRARRVSGEEAAAPGSVFAGEGFDACSTPSEQTMSQWRASSPYGAVGVYIGGENMACSQPNLSAAWVDTESAAGWHIVPIYVGLQAPQNTCGCAGITPAQATSEGTAAATDAVYDAQSIGLGPGNPIYDDMEGYPRESANSPAVLAFLQGWTEQLHADGYLSGIYSSDNSGIADLVSQVGTGYVEPDDIWIANWNGQASTSDPNVPSGDWASNQRLHQYQGATNATYGGTTINIDNDYVDGATAAYGASSSAPPTITAVPSATSPPIVEGVPVVGQTLVESHGGWSQSPSTYGVQWFRCTSAATGCAPISGASGQTYTLTPADAGHTVLATEVAANALGTSAATASAPTVPIAAKPSGYWSFSAAGAVYNSEYEPLWGSPASAGQNDFTGMAATAGGRGYWLVTRYAVVDAFGDATRLPRIFVAHPVDGIVRSPAGGYWLYTAEGNVYPSSGTSFYGSAAHSHLYDVTGMASLPNGPGYWLVTRMGRVLAFGHAPQLPAIRPLHPVIGIVAGPNHGYWLYTAEGNVYNSERVPFYGSPKVAGIVGMIATPDGRGYWLISRTGVVYAYGDAARYPNPTLTGGSVVGIAG